jgi:toxin ParE1/3/4
MELLAAFPLIGRDRPELGPQIRSFPFDSYVVFYRPSDTGVVILRVLHGSRDVEVVFGVRDRPEAVRYGD